MSERYGYPEAEYLPSPRNPHEQADDELRTYDTPERMRANLVALKLGYEKTACMRAMGKYAQFAAVVRSPESGIGNRDFNPDFYSGTLMAVHINLAPASEGVRQKVLSTDFLSELDNHPQRHTVEQSIKEWFEKWSGDDEHSWIHFYDCQTEAYQERAHALAERLYEDRSDTNERQYDFMLGYTFASNLVWTCGMAYRSRAPI